jgi:phage tail sheath protein FI
MAVTPTYPGVYVEEVPSGVRTIVGVSTSVGLFLGTAARGPIGEPVLCTNYLAFAREFGEDPTAGQLVHYVRLFFMNGGTSCWVMRLANGADPATVTLANEAGADVLELEAKSAGAAGNDIRAIVRYDGAQPEVTFTLELFRWELQGGQRVPVDAEVWQGLSMDPTSPSFAPDVLEQNSKLVTANEVGAVPPAPGVSQSGRALAHTTNTEFRDGWAALIGTTASTNRFQISVDASPYVEVNLATIDVAGMGATATTRTTTLPDAIKATIEAALQAAGVTGRTVTVSFPNGPAGNNSSVLAITSGGTGDVLIRSGTTGDLAVPLMLGSAQGGFEAGAHAARRPAPSGITLQASSAADLDALRALPQGDVVRVVLPTVNADGTLGPVTNVDFDLATTAAADLWSEDAIAGSPTGNSDGLREKLGIVAAAINGARAVSPQDPVFPWTASVAGNRLSIRPTGAPARENLLATGFAFEAATGAPPSAVANAASVAGHFNANTGAYQLGPGGLGLGGFHTPGTTGDDGTPPLAADYDAAYPVVARDVSNFNLMVLAPGAPGAPGSVPVQDLYGAASVFAQRERAVLLMDAPATWTEVQDALNPTTGVNAIRTGLVRNTAALFYPRVTVDEGGRDVQVGPAGAIAGLIARIDSTRGVWKSPAGTEADLRGVRGLERLFSDEEHGFLNPRAINTLRMFSGTVVNFGARTAEGDDADASEWKYLAIRRLAYYIEESLYRALPWVVFEPNDEPLWAQIRLNVGAFMHDLFRKGAFQGPKRDAYFVKCDAETTTQNDRNLGIVNIHVGFAPLKPAEFVILKLQQLAGQVEV